MAMLVIDGVALPDPSEYGVDLTDLDSENTTRNTSGVMLRDPVRLGVYKIFAGWNGITKTQLSAILSAVRPPELQIGFFDSAYTGVDNTIIEGHAGPRSSKLVIHLDEDDRPKSRWDLKINFVEF